MALAEHPLPFGTLRRAVPDSIVGLLLTAPPRRVVMLALDTSRRGIEAIEAPCDEREGRAHRPPAPHS